MLDDRTNTDALAGLALAAHWRDTRLIGQIVHPGRQAEVHVVRHPVAPSVLPRGSGTKPRWAWLDRSLRRLAARPLIWSLMIGEQATESTAGSIRGPGMPSGGGM